MSADSEFERCVKRRGEALSLFLDQEPTYAYFRPVQEYQRLARQGIKTGTRGAVAACQSDSGLVAVSGRFALKRWRGRRPWRSITAGWWSSSRRGAQEGDPDAASGCPARSLGISERTVKTHLGHLFEKLGVTSRTEAVKVATRRGLVCLEDG